jgi:hypothetical protein
MSGIAIAREGGLVRLIAGTALALGLSACSMGNIFGGGGSSGAAATYANASPTSAEIAAAAPALPAIATECPPIRVRPGQEALFSYANNSDPNPRQLKFQAVIDKQSRNCVVSNGLITVRMGVVGRLLLGPAGGQTSNVTLPLRFAVERDEVPLFSERYDIPVGVAPPAQSKEFVKVVENINVPYLGGESIVIWVGFDSSRG